MWLHVKNDGSWIETILHCVEVSSQDKRLFYFYFLFISITPEDKMKWNKPVLTYNSNVETSPSCQSESCWVWIKRKFHRIPHWVQHRLSTQWAEINQPQAEHDSQRSCYQSHWPKISGRRGRPPPIIFAWIIRPMNALRPCRWQFSQRETL